MAASSLVVQRQLSRVIKRFKFGELESAVMPVFPEISWSRLRSKLIKNHKKFSVTNALRVIEEVINDAHLRLADLKDRLSVLEVIDVSRHNKKKIWYGYELTGPNKPVNYLPKRETEENIKAAFNSYTLDMNVKAIIHDDVTFVCIKENIKRRTLRTTVPTSFALFLGQRYFFCTKINISPSFLKVMATILGYKDSERIKLMGKDLRSLMKLLWIKQQGILHTGNLNQPPVYGMSDPIVKNIGIDYTQTKQRKDYIEQCFGKDPPTLELLVINGPCESIQHNDMASRLPNDTIRINWEFRSKNIAKFLTNLTEKRIFVSPLPDYVSNLMNIGKNELTIQTV